MSSHPSRQTQRSFMVGGRGHLTGATPTDDQPRDSHLEMWMFQQVLTWVDD